jgi:curved DNA-binding protein
VAGLPERWTKMDYKDYYKILGVARDADANTIKKAYRKLARQHHPDVNPGDDSAEARFKDINEAYEVLSDRDKRQTYDRFGARWRDFQRTGGRPQDFNWANWAAAGGSNTYRTVNPEEFEQMFGGGFSDFFETLFGRGGGRGAGGPGDLFGTRAAGRQRAAQQGQGRDLEQTLLISLEEAYRGTTKLLQREDGTRLEVKIPAGVRTGSRIRVRGQGRPGGFGAPGGDLYLRVKISPHPSLERDGNDLRLTVIIDLYTALLGGETTIETLDRPLKLKIPAGTQPGRVFRLQHKGMPNMKDHKKSGDLFVTVRVELPKTLTEKQKALLREVQKLSS